MIRIFVAVLPVNHQLNLKSGYGVWLQKLQMANPKDAERLTGYLVGGISPLGQKKRLKPLLMHLHKRSAKSM